MRLRKTLRHDTADVLHLGRAQAVIDPANPPNPLVDASGKKTPRYPCLAAARIYRSRFDEQQDQRNETRGVNQQNLATIIVSTPNQSNEFGSENGPTKQFPDSITLEVIAQIQGDFDADLDDKLDDLTQEIRDVLFAQNYPVNLSGGGTWFGRYGDRLKSLSTEYGIEESDYRYAEAAMTFTVVRSDCFHEDKGLLPKAEGGDVDLDLSGSVDQTRPDDAVLEGDPFASGSSTDV